MTNIDNYDSVKKHVCLATNLHGLVYSIEGVMSPQEVSDCSDKLAKLRAEAGSCTVECDCPPLEVESDTVQAVAVECTAELAVSVDGREDNDPINPNHYQFSNGAEVIDITENLTFNGGNAIKYLASATRLDGQNKGAVLEDLRKALWYVEREITRLEADEAVTVGVKVEAL